jgi:hypothetical protein
MSKFEKRVERLYDYSRLGYAREWLRARGRQDALFVWIPKTAGTSLVSLLRLPKLKRRHLVKYRFTNRGSVTFGHQDYRQLRAQGLVSDAFDRNAFKFSFVRDPFDRAVSLYFYLIKDAQIDASLSFLAFCRRLPQGIPPIGLYQARGLSQANPQSHWLSGVTLDFLGRFEQIDRDIDELSRRLGLPERRLPHLNPTRHRDFRDYYCSESEALVRAFYAEDFQRFGYRSSL